eukprot:403354001
MVAKRDHDSSTLSDFKVNYSKSKSTAQSIIRNMSNSIHKKYYDYILSKLKFEKIVEEEKFKEKQEQKKLRLPRLVESDDEEQELFKSLSTYIKNDQFMEKNKKLIRERNISQDKNAQKISSNTTNHKSQKSIELSQFLKDFEKKKNLMMLDGEEDYEFRKNLSGAELMSTRKNKQIMNKMYDLMTQKSKNRLRWEQLEKIRQEKLIALQKKEQEEMERLKAQELIEQQYLNMMSSRPQSMESRGSSNSLLNQDEDPNLSKSRAKKISNLRDLVKQEIKKEQPSTYTQTFYKPNQVRKSFQESDEIIQGSSALQNKLTELYKKSEMSVKEAKNKNKLRVKLMTQESMQLPVIQQSISRNQSQVLLSKNNSGFMHKQYQSSLQILEQNQRSFINLIPTSTVAFENQRLQDQTIDESTKSILGQLDFNNNAQLNHKFYSSQLFSRKLSTNLINNSILLQQIKDQSLNLNHKRSFQNNSMSSFPLNKSQSSKQLRFAHLQVVDNVLDNCQSVLSGDIKFTKNSIHKLNRFIKYQQNLEQSPQEKQKIQDIKSVAKAVGLKLQENKKSKSPRNRKIKANIFIESVEKEGVQNIMNQSHEKTNKNVSILNATNIVEDSNEKFQANYQKQGKKIIKVKSVRYIKKIQQQHDSQNEGIYQIKKIGQVNNSHVQNLTPINRSVIDSNHKD